MSASPAALSGAPAPAAVPPIAAAATDASSLDGSASACVGTDAAASSVATTTTPDPLAELRGLHLPEPVGLWPLAPGWWMLAGLLALAACATAYAHARRRRSVVRHALRELDGLSRTPGADLQALATTLAALLRRVALLRFGRERVASLHGVAWQEFLAAHAPRSRRRRTRFSSAAGVALALAPYAPAGSLASGAAGQIDRRALLVAARAWIEENA